jgi:hypothetical protein
MEPISCAETLQNLQCFTLLIPESFSTRVVCELVIAPMRATYPIHPRLGYLVAEGSTVTFS